MKWFWLSFSLKGINQGVCNVQARGLKKAMKKAERFEIVPEFDDVEDFVIEEAELPADTFSQNNR